MNLPTFAAALAMGSLAWAGGPTSPTQTTAPAKKATTAPTVRKAPATSAAKTPVRSTPTASAKRVAKKAPVVRASWRNRQTSPSADRYREIQQALVARGYLSQDDANGVWSSSSTEALKKFQAEQTLDSNGKIDSLSLIALGLGPKHDSLPSNVVDGNFTVESGRN